MMWEFCNGFCKNGNNVGLWLVLHMFEGTMFWFPTRWFRKWSSSILFWVPRDSTDADVFFKLVLTTPFCFMKPPYWHWRESNAESFGSSNNCVTVTLVLLTPGGSELGRDVLADLTDVLQRQFVQHTSNLWWTVGHMSHRIMLNQNYTVSLCQVLQFCITSLSSSWAKSDSASLVKCPPPPR